MDNKLDITNELLLALMNQIYSLELLLSDVYIGKANLRYSNEALENDKKIIDMMKELVTKNLTEGK